MNAFTNYNDLARLEYGRMLWKHPADRQRLIAHWTDPRHPYRDRFEKHRALIEEILCSRDSDPDLDRRLRSRSDSTSLRALIREIPPIFGSFW